MKKRIRRSRLKMDPLGRVCGEGRHVLWLTTRYTVRYPISQGGEMLIRHICPDLAQTALWRIL